MPKSERVLVLWLAVILAILSVIVVVPSIDFSFIAALGKKLMELKQFSVVGLIAIIVTGILAIVLKNKKEGIRILFWTYVVLVSILAGIKLFTVDPPTTLVFTRIWIGILVFLLSFYISKKERLEVFVAYTDLIGAIFAFLALFK